MFFPFRDNIPTRRTPVLTYGIIAVNVAVFLWMVRLPEDAQEAFVFGHGFVPARIGQLFHGQELIVKVPKGEPMALEGRVVVEVEEVRLPPAPGRTLLSLISCMFLHGGWWHLLGNMWFLWLFGNNVEDRLGRLLYPVFYLGGGIFASACQWAVAPGSGVPVIGASGAVATVLGGYAITWPFARIQTLVFLLIFVTIIELPALVVLGVWFLGQVLAATQMQPDNLYQAGVAFWAHVGGFVAGLVLMPWLSNTFGAQPPSGLRRGDFVDTIVVSEEDDPYYPRPPRPPW